jgi:hypothetical protein
LGIRQLPAGSAFAPLFPAADLFRFFGLAGMAPGLHGFDFFRQGPESQKPVQV